MRVPTPTEPLGQTAWTVATKRTTESSEASLVSKSILSESFEELKSEIEYMEVECCPLVVLPLALLYRNLKFTYVAKKASLHCSPKFERLQHVSRARRGSFLIRQVALESR